MIANSPTRWISSFSPDLLVGDSTSSYFLLFRLPSVAALADQSEPVFRVTKEIVNFEIEIASSLKVFACSWEIITSRSKLAASIFHEDHTVTARVIHFQQLPVYLVFRFLRTVGKWTSSAAGFHVTILFCNDDKWNYCRSWSLSPWKPSADDSSFYLACNKLFQLTNHQTEPSIQNAEFLNLILKN